MPVISRYAVGAFNNWPEALGALQELHSGSKPIEDISYLGLKSKLQTLPIEPLIELAFPTNGGQIACSAGHISKHLADRLSSGAASLRSALVTWLIPRHAEQIQQMVNEGKIVVWVRLDDPEDERRAYRALLAAGCGSVGVHDLI